MMVSKSPTLVVLLLATAAVVAAVRTDYRNGNPKALNRRWWWFDSEEITEKPVPAQVQDVQDQVQVGQTQDQTSQDLVQINQVQDQTSQDLVQINQVQDQTSQDLVQVNQVQDQISQDQDLDNIVQSAHLQEPVGQQIAIIPGQHTKPLRPAGYHTRPSLPQQASIQQEPLNINPGDLTRPLRPQYALRELSDAERSQRWFWDNSVEDRSDELERQRVLNRQGPAQSQRQQLPARISQTSGGLFWDSPEDYSDEWRQQNLGTNRLTQGQRPLAGGRYYDSPEIYSNEFYTNELYTNELYSNELYDRSDEWRRPLIGSNGGGQRRPNQVRPIYGGPTQGRNPGGANDLPNQGRPNQGRPTQGRIPGGAHGRPTQGGKNGRPNQGVQTPEPALAPYTGGVHADVSTAEPVNFDERHQGGQIGGAYVPPKK